MPPQLCNSNYVPVRRRFIYGIGFRLFYATNSVNILNTRLPHDSDDRSRRKRFAEAVSSLVLEVKFCFWFYLENLRSRNINDRQSNKKNTISVFLWLCPGRVGSQTRYRKTSRWAGVCNGRTNRKLRTKHPTSAGGTICGAWCKFFFLPLGHLYWIWRPNASQR